MSQHENPNLVSVGVWVGFDRVDGGTWGKPALFRETAEASIRGEMEVLLQAHPDSGWTLEEGLADVPPTWVVLACESPEDLRFAVLHLTLGNERQADTIMRLARPASVIPRPTAPEPPSDGLLGELLAALGWQGGTRAQALEAVRGLVNLARAHGGGP